MDVREAAEGLAIYAVERGLIEETDLLWAYNRILECVGAVGPAPETTGTDEQFALEDALDVLVNVAAVNGMCEDSGLGRDRMAMRVMGALMPRPSEVASVFWVLHSEQGPRAATDYLYQLCCDANYVRVADIARNLVWETETQWGALEITINKSKPEKDPADIAAAAKAPKGDVYPACQLCVENEGYPGRPAAAGEHPARQNLRIVPISLDGEPWGFQYSPYAYFEEHCIAMSKEHRPMHIDRAAFTCLLDFVDLFPQYFIGSNADLPIVGGSILSHDHFQGGLHTFPMMRAESVLDFEMVAYPGVRASVVKWPLSVLRLESESRDELLEAACHVLDVWRIWSDESVGVIGMEADGTRHNTVTPMLRREHGAYVLWLALRCNVTSEEHPMGVFHPHEDKWHVKKENIGLIEVMGEAILPPRLEVELDAGRITRDEIGRVFGAVLEDAGVFKWDGSGRAAMARFVAAL